MSTEEANKIVPEETKAVIALLKKGMMSKGFLFLALRGIIYIIVAAFVLGKWTVRIDVFEMNMLDKMNTVIEGQKSDRADIKDLLGRVFYLEGGIAHKPKE